MISRAALGYTIARGVEKSRGRKEQIPCKVLRGREIEVFWGVVTGDLEFRYFGLAEFERGG